MDLGLRERVCVVTGGSRGIGRATALRLACEGATVTLVGRDAGALQAVVEEARRRGAAAADAVTVDLTDPAAPERVRDWVLERHGPAEVLVNNAGTSAARGIEALRDEDWQAQWELNVIVPMRLMRALIPGMLERRWGRVVNVSSSSGKRPGQRNLAYSVSKAAELSLSRGYADAYAGQGILINSVTPGPVGTGLWLGPDGLAAQIAREEGSSVEEVVRRTERGVPLGRLGEEDEVAAVVAFLCSERASFVTGSAWSVDGGIVPGII